MKHSIITTLAGLALLAGAANADPLARFDVAEDMSRFVFSGPTHDDGMPAYGAPFLTQGYIYPAGTLDGGVEGTLEDGSPAFPDLVIGTWTCDGYFVGDGMYTQTGDVVVTRQVFQFENGVLISQGTEIVDLNVPAARAVTGGTGDYAGVGPALHQTLLGMSDGYGVRLQFELDLDEEPGAAL